MSEFHNYSQFVAAAYIVAGFILTVSAVFFWFQLKKNESAFAKAKARQVRNKKNDND